MIQIQNHTPIVWLADHGPPPAVWTCDRFPRIRIRWDADRDRVAVEVRMPDDAWKPCDHFPCHGQPVEDVARGYFQAIADAIDAGPLPLEI